MWAWAGKNVALPFHSLFSLDSPLSAASASALLPAGAQPSVAKPLDAHATTPTSPSLVATVSAEPSGQRRRPPAPDLLLCPAAVAVAARWSGAPVVVSAAFSVASPPLLHLTHVCTNGSLTQELRYLDMAARVSSRLTIWFTANRSRERDYVKSVAEVGDLAGDAEQRRGGDELKHGEGAARVVGVKDGEGEAALDVVDERVANAGHCTLGVHSGAPASNALAGSPCSLAAAALPTEKTRVMESVLYWNRRWHCDASTNGCPRVASTRRAPSIAGAHTWTIHPPLPPPCTAAAPARSAASPRRLPPPPSPAIPLPLPRSHLRTHAYKQTPSSHGPSRRVLADQQAQIKHIGAYTDGHRRRRRRVGGGG
uniref:Uncharacterized protein n=1 Tax=Oryza meridionalis TaxID=40149 RepID=A0A0E0CF70_9ORYZ